MLLDLRYKKCEIKAVLVQNLLDGGTRIKPSSLAVLETRAIVYTPERASAIHVIENLAERGNRCSMQRSSILKMWPRALGWNHCIRRG